MSGALKMAVYLAGKRFEKLRMVLLQNASVFGHLPFFKLFTFTAEQDSI